MLPFLKGNSSSFADDWKSCKAKASILNIISFFLFTYKYYVSISKKYRFDVYNMPYNISNEGSFFKFTLSNRCTP